MTNKSYYMSHIRDRIPGDPHCPTCGAGADGATSLNDAGYVRQIKVGDFAVCAYCGSINRYGIDLQLRSCTPDEEMNIIQKDPRLRDLTQKLEWAARKMRKEKRGPFSR